MKRILVAMIAFGSTFASVHAQDVDVDASIDVSVAAADTADLPEISEAVDSALPEISEVVDSTLCIPESLESNVDSLLHSWHVSYYTNKDSDCIELDRDIDPADSIYVQRLSALPKVIEMPFNATVKKSIQLYTEKRRTLIQYMLGLADYYFPSIEQILDENGLPLELKYLVIVESAMNPTALSRAGASGLWQFMLPTGKIYGLEINSLVDERRDPVKSTYAACRYLKDLYAIYGDWNLVIAAYNCGPGNVNKAIRRSKGQKDYWAIYNYLPRETRSYVPLFIGATYAMNYYREHNICPVSTAMPISSDTVTIDRLLHLEQVAEVLKMDIEQLRALNPEFKKDIIPGNYKPYALHLPTTKTGDFIELEQDIYACNDDRYFTNRDYAGQGASRSTDRISKITHRVVKGESMLSIANSYGVTTSQIKKWNGLRSSRVQPGKKLTLYADNGGYVASTAPASIVASEMRKMPEETAKTVKTEEMAKTEEAEEMKKTALQEPPGSISYHKYKVKKGDSFYTIAKRYPGVAARDLMQFNNIRSSTLKIGQIIKIPVG
jgi:membrane-bound lytic murein transglycosylase D